MAGIRLQIPPGHQYVQHGRLPRVFARTAAGKRAGGLAATCACSRQRNGVGRSDLRGHNHNDKARFREDSINLAWDERQANEELYRQSGRDHRRRLGHGPFARDSAGARRLPPRARRPQCREPR
ncbi:protein of unknown function [Paraburkholderia dioscoreae]|uniref:Uncharacterized protein n=1 Tax=Paraburkholderia dioscoreae TaxID=2604047 RepID=A0A5Q4ZHC2_9BURK|nr:protein of unknown function [Paraburkholderia dioscoreae]